VPRFAKAADDQLALAVVDEGDGLLERQTETIGERIKSPRLVVQDSAPKLENAYWGRIICRHERALLMLGTAVKLDVE
jgi:hypothetical protein